MLFLLQKIKIICDVIIIIFIIIRVLIAIFKLNNRLLKLSLLHLLIRYINLLLIINFFKIMATIKQGVFGAISGKVGNLIGSSWKGIAVLKIKPTSVANPKTAGQVAQRSKFSNTTTFASLILAVVIAPLWNRFAVQMSGFNAFVQTNIDLFTSELPSPAANLVISKGKMDSTVIDSIASTNSNPQVTLTWSDDSNSGYKLATDLGYCVVVNESTGEIVFDGGNVTRVDEAITVNFAEAPVTGNVINAYLAFKRADGTIVSNTSFKTKIV